MSPSPTTFSMIAARQEDGSSAVTGAMTVPECVTTCMAQGDTTGCEGPDDFACLCQSTDFSNSVAVCWVAECKSEEITVGLRYSSGICESFSNGGNGTTGGDGAVPVLTGTPHVFQDAFVNVQAIMSSICAAVLAVAIVLGFMACRSRLQAERETSDRSTWSGVATYAETKHGNKSQILSQGGTNTFQSRSSPDLEGITSFSAFGGAAGTAGVTDSPGSQASRAYSSNRFTNRMTMEGEEIEMSVHTSSSNSPDTPLTGKYEGFATVQSAEPSPTASSFITQHDAEFRQNGAAADSTTNLTPKNEARAKF